jgi:RNA polymerase sigma factor (sigma-70 family)
VSTRESELTPGASPPGLSRKLTAVFDAFHETSHRPWLRYTHLQVGSREAAEHVVHDTYVHLASVWEHALRQESVDGYGWALLKEHIAAWLTRNMRPRALVQTAAFDQDSSALLLTDRGRLTRLEASLGLYRAIAELPERQYDVIVLRHVLGLPDERVARHLGVSESTVRFLARHARDKLAKTLDLGIHHEE